MAATTSNGKLSMEDMLARMQELEQQLRAAEARAAAPVGRIPAAVSVRYGNYTTKVRTTRTGSVVGGNTHRYVEVSCPGSTLRPILWAEEAVPLMGKAATAAVEAIRAGRPVNLSGERA